MDQLFTLARQLKESWEIANTVYSCFVDLEKAYDQVHLVALWVENGVMGTLMQAIWSLFNQSVSCVCILGRVRFILSMCWAGLSLVTSLVCVLYGQDRKVELGRGERSVWGPQNCNWVQWIKRFTDQLLQNTQ